MKRTHLLILLILVVFSSCVTSRKVNLMQEPGKHGIPEYADTLNYEEYTVRIGDRIYVQVYSVDEKVAKLFNADGNQSSSIRNQNGGANSTYDLYTYLVLDDGCIDFPLIGKIEVRGKSTRQIKYLLEQELSSYIKNYGDYNMISCEVNVVQRSYSVISNGGTGTFQIRKEKINIYEALAQAGDVGDWSDRSQVRIVREIEGQTKIITFDLRSKDIINSEYYYIQPNDVIYVQKLRGQAFGVSNAATTVSIVATTLAFGGFVYGLVVRIMNAVNNSK